MVDPYGNGCGFQGGFVRVEMRKAFAANQGLVNWALMGVFKKP
jgi:hypothetical protein